MTKYRDHFGLQDRTTHEELCIAVMEHFRNELVVGSEDSVIWCSPLQLVLAAECTALERVAGSAAETTWKSSSVGSLLQRNSLSRCLCAQGCSPAPGPQQATSEGSPRGMRMTCTSWPSSRARPGLQPCVLTGCVQKVPAPARFSVSCVVQRVAALLVFWHC